MYQIKLICFCLFDHRVVSVANVVSNVFFFSRSGLRFILKSPHSSSISHKTLLPKNIVSFPATEIIPLGQYLTKRGKVKFKN